MSHTAHSEFGEINRLVIKPASNAFSSDKKIAREWQKLNYLKAPNFVLANEEYENFERVLKDTGTELLHLPVGEGLSIDSLYCRDASVATDFGMIICRMGKEARAGEPKAQKKFFADNKIAILGEIIAPGTLEGGDIVWLDNKTLAVGHTYRTNLEGIAQLKAMLEPKGIEVVVAELPHYRGPSDVFHLMSILSPVDKNLAVVYSPLMPISFRNLLLERGFQLVEVPEEEFDSMGCNVLALAPRRCLMVEGNPITEKRLRDAGCEVTTYNGHEISVKGGGGPTCLTRPIFRGV
ncbi:arginine deiminase family protein [uncultured Imperialibacter sp.]|uniref:dimethylarginine dimethylaminohydrolase family protein n=1 Tax=uncultured Imperialibacter sp. TaxID=1672639 RepID=UPI0030DA440D|tara:strand:+ start:30391 stop:31269 length:879 start_codon:yes stop_codon:yes gene_type:complete